MKVSEWAKNKTPTLTLRAASRFCLDEFVSSAVERILWTVHWWKTDERLGGLICCVAALMPSGWWFEEDTWDQHTWTMSWGVTLNWDELLFIPRALLLFLFPIRRLSRSLWSPVYLLSSSWCHSVTRPVVECNITCLNTMCGAYANIIKYRSADELSCIIQATQPYLK